MKKWIEKNRTNIANFTTFIACSGVLAIFLSGGLSEKEYITPAKFLMYFAGMFTTFVYLYLWQLGVWLIKKYYKKGGVINNPPSTPEQDEC